MADIEEDDPIDDKPMPLLEHLMELRTRLIWSIAAFIVCFMVSYYFSNRIYFFLAEPLAEVLREQGSPDPHLIYTQLYEAFFTRIKVAFFAGAFIAFPIIANQIWQFVAPGLYRKEKRAFLPFLLVTPLLFLTGAALAYYVTMPVALHFLLSYQGNVGGVQQTALPGVGNYLDFVTKFIFGFGVAFLLPVLLMLMERAGIVSRAQLRRGRRYAIVAAFAIAAVLTPPDVVSQLSLAIPLVLLYEVALIAIWFTERRRKRDTATEPG